MKAGLGRSFAGGNTMDLIGRAELRSTMLPPVREIVQASSVRVTINALERLNYGRIKALCLTDPPRRLEAIGGVTGQAIIRYLRTRPSPGQICERLSAVGRNGRQMYWEDCWRSRNFIGRRGIKHLALNLFVGLWGSRVGTYSVDWFWPYKRATAFRIGVVRGIAISVLARCGLILESAASS